MLRLYCKQDDGFFALFSNPNKTLPIQNSENSDDYAAQSSVTPVQPIQSGPYDPYNTDMDQTALPAINNQEYIIEESEETSKRWCIRKHLVFPLICKY